MLPIIFSFPREATSLPAFSNFYLQLGSEVTRFFLLSYLWLTPYWCQFWAEIHKICTAGNLFFTVVVLRCFIVLTVMCPDVSRARWRIRSIWHWGFNKVTVWFLSKNIWLGEGYRNESEIIVSLNKLGNLCVIQCFKIFKILSFVFSIFKVSVEQVLRLSKSGDLKVRLG